nr:hypothetical protein BDOA9_0158840 [Bradyrhizobium sp. DOA9]
MRVGGCYGRTLFPNKNSKTTPCTVDRPCQNKDLRDEQSIFLIFEINPGASGKTVAYWHHRNSHERHGLQGRDHRDAVTHKPLWTFSKFAFARNAPAPQGLSAQSERGVHLRRATSMIQRAGPDVRASA